MPAGTRSAIAMLTDFFAADDIEATARRTGFVQRTSKITGKLFLALVTFGTWSEGKTTLAQLAAKGTQLRQPVDVSPEAMHQRMNKKALLFSRTCSARSWPNSNPSTPMWVMMACLRPFPKSIWRTALVLNCPMLSKRRFPVREAVRPKPAPRFKPCGTIKAVCLIILR